jgi:hypothetical protein
MKKEERRKELMKRKHQEIKKKLDVQLQEK